MTKELRLATRFGFLVSDDAELGRSLPGWRQHRFGTLAVWCHPECRVRRLHGPGWAAMVFGDIYVAHGEGSTEQHIQRVAMEGAFEPLDDLAGRYALLVDGPPGVRIFHDPFGSRSVFYREGEGVALASHVALLASVFGEEPDPAAVRFRDSLEYGQRGTRYLPGDRTMQPSVYALVPNNYYDLGTQRTVRYWPRAPLAEGTLGEFHETCDQYFLRTSEFLEGRYRLLLGVTGGVDARALLVGLRWAGACGSLFTWKGGRVTEPEIPLIRTIVTRLDWPHEFMEVGRQTRHAQDVFTQRATDLATGGARGPSALSANMSGLAKPGDVFLRGYGGEILRGFYNRHNRELKERSAEELATLYLTRRVANPNPWFLRFAIAAFEGFLERANFGADLLGRDPLDLFYWEHRMGTWGSLMLSEMDPVLYSMAGLNSRRLYDAAFAIPNHQRLGTSLLLGLVARYDQTLANVGVVS